MQNNKQYPLTKILLVSTSTRSFHLSLSVIKSPRNFVLFHSSSSSSLTIICSRVTWIIILFNYCYYSIFIYCPFNIDPAVISDTTHVLRKHLAEARQFSYNLCPRAHGFTLYSKDKQNFIPWLSYKDMYQVQ